MSKGDPQLQKLLEENELGSYAERFAQHEIDLDTFLQLRENHLISMGINLIGPRLKILKLISQLLYSSREEQQHHKRQHSLDSDDKKNQSLALPIVEEPKNLSDSVLNFRTSSLTPSPQATPSPQPSPQILFTTKPTEQTTEPKAQRTTSFSSASFRPNIYIDELIFFECIGTGSFGSVFRGLWNGKIVAIKKLVAPCEQEAELLSKVRHRNIIQFFGVVSEPSNFCLVMEYAVDNLKNLIHKQQSEIKPSNVIDWSRQIASGMNYLHTEAPDRIIHRDLKPGNVLVAADGTMKVTDFGLSRIRDAQNTDKMSSVGTFEYMAPEVIRGEPYNEKADVYSFGVLLWEMMTRQIPYSGLQTLSIAYGVGVGTLKLPIPKNCPAAIVAMLEKCWERDRHNRLSFFDIIRSLEIMQKSTFLTVSYEDFVKMQGEWKNELTKVFESYKKQIETMRLREIELSVAELSIDEREKRVKELELEVKENISFGFTCWYTLRRHTEDIIGIGLKVVRKRPTQISSIYFLPEYLSATAFFDKKAQRSMNKDLKFDNFLPIYISEDHAHRALPMMQHSFVSIILGTEQTKTGTSPSNSSFFPAQNSFRPKMKRTLSSKASVEEKDNSNHFSPEMALVTLCSLLNETIVGTIQGKYHPHKSLELYCVFHRLLIFFATKYRSLLSYCEKSVTDFIKKENSRNKSEVSNIGEFMSLIGVIQIDWENLIQVLIPEILQRNWQWILKSFPRLENNIIFEPNSPNPIKLHRISEKEFLESSFNGSVSGIRVTLLHLYFIKHVAHYKSFNLEQRAKHYDDLLGQPSIAMKQDMEKALKEIMSISSFAEYFDRIGYKTESRNISEISLILRQSFAKSLSKKYCAFSSKDELSGGYVIVETS